MLRTAITAAALIAAAAPFAHAQLAITEVMAQTTAGSASTINGDWWELTNTGATAIDLSGYQWADTEDALPGTDTNFFPSFVINPGQSIIILEEAAANEDAWLTNWGLAPGAVVILGTDEMLDDSTPDGDTFSGLGSGGDAVFFYDPAGTLLSSYLYDAVIRGTSFEASRSGTDLGLSVVGENGAFAGANGDTGSPGTSVPTPAGASLLGLALLGAARRRH
jgi:MYXO-CTERM domain-containing protein